MHIVLNQTLSQSNFFFVLFSKNLIFFFFKLKFFYETFIKDTTKIIFIIIDLIYINDVVIKKQCFK